jgi:hypothetical protein
VTGTRTTRGVLLLTVVALAGCGGGSHFANDPRPATPVNLSVYVNDKRVSISPSSLTPGAVTITITNQSSSSQAIEVVNAGGSSAISTTGPISPQATDQVTVSLPAGHYTVAVAPNRSTEAAAATPTGVAPASLTVHGQRPNSNNQLLQP